MKEIALGPSPGEYPFTIVHIQRFGKFGLYWGRSRVIEAK
jgi:hypothetical protein